MKPLQASCALGFLIVAASYSVGIEPRVAGADQYQSPAATVSAHPRRPSQKPVNAAGAATKAFLDRLAEYVTFHNNVKKTVPPLTETNDPVKIAAREAALGEALIKARPDAKPGDFFIKEYQPYLIRIIRTDFARRSVADRKALIQELPKDVKIDVNQVYPTTLPLATFPPKLLRLLPELPPELEYRIVGRDLVLRDVEGNVIVDIMRGVFPIPT
jgi:hypothetical protein